MSYKPTYNSGQWIAMCDSCGKKFKANELRQRWDGLMVDDACFEPRHPQDFVRGVADFQTPFWTRPEPEDTFVGVCSPNGISCIVDFAVASCAVVNFVSTIFDSTINPPSCDVVYYFVDGTVSGYETIWACGSLVVDEATLTIEGLVGIR